MKKKLKLWQVKYVVGTQHKSRYVVGTTLVHVFAKIKTIISPKYSWETPTSISVDLIPGDIQI